jgi:hypothetical protein
MQQYCTAVDEISDCGLKNEKTASIIRNPKSPGCNFTGVPHAAALRHSA